eukprot:CAMPEP_0169278798 /NCGR_PEP_ID=MMETSP1016-20121227/54553_1 /TAXON_ID=342587 /ORGANISM="Karlodinium micrum, Strain CCMP2283" /LENGTH=335 /DNA_ID=CAMNT_0009366655 /DNA_START=37 /DNA_END=1041 /DNA_ORIENTATION=+
MPVASEEPIPGVMLQSFVTASTSDWASECSTVADEADVASWTSSPKSKAKPSLWERRKGNGMIISTLGATAENVQARSLQCDPEVSGKYDVKEILGSGSLATVYRAVPRESPDKQVALKALKCHNDPETVKVAKREFEILKSLPAHPCIINALDFHDLASGGAVLVLEYVPGLTLEAATKGAPDRRLLSPSVQHLSVALFKAVAHLHQHTVLHRDIKPSNVFVSACHSELRLADFNVAKDISVGASFTPVGTPLYRAPEVAWGGSCSESSDVWSAGLTMLFAFLGRVPQVASVDVEALLKPETAPDSFKASLCLTVSVEVSKRPSAAALASEEVW